MLMYIAYAATFLCSVLWHYRVPLPCGTDYALFILALMVELTSFAHHLSGRDSLNVQVNYTSKPHLINASSTNLQFLALLACSWIRIVRGFWITTLFLFNKRYMPYLNFMCHIWYHFRWPAEFPDPHLLHLQSCGYHVVSHSGDAGHIKRACCTQPDIAVHDSRFLVHRFRVYPISARGMAASSLEWGCPWAWEDRLGKTSKYKNKGNVVHFIGKIF
jgi:hypothetical protein